MKTASIFDLGVGIGLSLVMTQQFGRRALQRNTFLVSSLVSHVGVGSTVLIDPSVV
jgi:hypothetical protein